MHRMKTVNGKIMNRCPDEAILERLLAEDDKSRAEWSMHVGSCDRCRSWLSEAQADDAMLTSVREAWSRGRNDSSISDRLIAPTSPRRIPHDGGDPVIPGFELLRRIGEGGMGMVYEARQVQPSRIVAIKVVRGGASASPLRNQLIEHEAAALARLRHPNIAAVYSAGRTDDGLFYVAMERIDGPRVTQFAKDAAHTIRQRLALFEKTCRAIQHAHQHGVVHGDIKPGNIMMDVVPATSARPANGASRRHGTLTDFDSAGVKVLDFGLSRLVGPDDCETPAEAVRIRGTPAYMSPEQAAGTSQIDHRSDVYALGALAYELLTERPVHELNGLSVEAALARVRTGEFVAPSAHDRRLRGDVERIVMKALAREPAERYAGAAELADDVRRYLMREPVRARPASTLYHAQCFLRRHALGCTFAACAVLALIAFAAVETINARRVARERDRAVRVNKFMQNMIADLDPAHTGGPETSLRSVLDDAAARVESELADDPETAATTQLNIGQSYVALGLFDRAEAQFRSALARRQAVHGDEHGDVAEAMHELGLALKLSNRLDEAEEYYIAALDMRRRLLPADDDGIPESLNDLGGLRVEQGRFAEAAIFFREALALRKAKHGENDKEYAIGLGNIAMLEFYQGNTLEGDRLLQDAIEKSRKTLGDENPILIKRLMQAIYMSMHRGADPVAAEKNLRDLMDRQRKLLGPSHPEVVISVQNLAIMLRMRGDSAAAAELEREWGVPRAVKTKPD